jgi:hypothetical protein
MPRAALCGCALIDDSTAKLQRTGRVRGDRLHRLHRATVSRSREKVPINPIFSISAERENAGQRPVPVHETRRPAFQWWRGNGVIFRLMSYEYDGLARSTYRSAAPRRRIVRTMEDPVNSGV